MIGVVAISGQPLIRYGLHFICQESTALKIIGEVGSIRDGLRMIDAMKPDVTIVDLPRVVDGRGEDDALALLTARDSAVVVLTNPIPQSYVDDLRNIGVVGLASRTAGMRDISNVLLAAARREFHCGIGVKRPRTVKRLDDDAVVRITEREAEIIHLVGAGSTNREIAQLLHVAESTVKFHVSNLIRKLGADRRTGLAYLAARREIFAGSSAVYDSRHVLRRR